MSEYLSTPKLTSNTLRELNLLSSDSDEEPSLLNLARRLLSVIRAHRPVGSELAQLRRVLLSALGDGPADLNCVSTVNETMASPKLSKLTSEFEDQEKTHAALKNEVSALKAKLEHFEAENRTLKIANSRFAAKNAELQGQCTTLVKLVSRVSAASETQKANTEFSHATRIKREADQKINFLYAKLEQYIIRAGHLETALSDSQFARDRVVRELTAQNSALRARLGAVAVNGRARDDSASRFSLGKSSLSSPRRATGNAFVFRSGSARPKEDCRGILDEMLAAVNTVDGADDPPRSEPFGSLEGAGWKSTLSLGN